MTHFGTQCGTQKEGFMVIDYIQKRGKWYSYRRRIPAHVAHLDERREIKISLKTQSHKEAMIRAAIYNDEIEKFWKALIQSGSAQNKMQKYRAAVQLAKAHGFAYRSSDQIAISALNEIIERIDKTAHQRDEEALLGGADEDIIQLSDCCELYWPLVTDRLVDKSDHKIIKWKNPRKAAIEAFIEVVGNKPLVKISRNDVLTFKSWWNDRIAKGLSADTANKQFRYVRDVLQTVALQNELPIDFDPLFVKVRFQYVPKSRPPFEASFVQKTLLPGLDKLNDRDRMVMYAMADTGARESEIFSLRPEDIFLNTPVPYIWIRPYEGNRLKTNTSERQIPLVGVALYAFQQNPDGFEHAGNPDVFSAIVNNYLTDHNLRPSPRHSAYSLRHTFKDRLRDAEAPEEIIDGLMGHKKSGPKYGRGHKLETKKKWLSQIAFTVLQKSQ